MKSGESIREIVTYWLPELVSSTFLITAPLLINSYLIAQLNSTTKLGALGMASNLLHFIIKFAEAVPVAGIAIVGRHNGAKEYKKCGHDLGDLFWTTFILGLVVFAILYTQASLVFQWLGVPENMHQIGVSFLRLSSLHVLLTFTFWSFTCFMRGVKNTQVPMLINSIGVVVFIFFDYALILGRWGFPEMQLLGCAVATIIQYSVMNLFAIAYIMLNSDYKKYFSQAFFLMFSAGGAWRLINLSWPIVIDKTSLSFAYLWLSKMIAPMDKYVIASFDVIKNLEKVAVLPALAFAQVITFLVSNRLGAQDFEGARDNVKKVLILAIISFIVCIVPICWFSYFFVGCFDMRGKFTEFAATVLPYVSILTIFDIIQVVLAGALRGAGDVRTVMWGRFLALFGFFIPCSYLLSRLPIESKNVKFILLYTVFYLANGIIGLVFIRRIRGIRWQQKRID